MPLVKVTRASGDAPMTAASTSSILRTSSFSAARLLRKRCARTFSCPIDSCDVANADKAAPIAPSAATTIHGASATPATPPAATPIEDIPLASAAQRSHQLAAFSWRRPRSRK